ncbi:MAG: hypothetical protein MSA17_04825 [Collinsella sp.]|nr:hypothetical protein [Collinsella sp.]
MRINELTADEFAASMALIGEAVEHIANGELGKSLLGEMKAGAGKASSEEDAAEWGMGIIAKYLPRVLKENVTDAYMVLAAIDGQTVEEYKACFTPAKFAADTRALVKACGKDGDLRALFGSFFA